MGKPILERRRTPAETGIETFVHRDVEIRTAGGGAYRGELQAVDRSFLYLLRPNGRSVLIPRGAVVAVVDEQRATTTDGAPGLATGDAAAEG